MLPRLTAVAVLLASTAAPAERFAAQHGHWNVASLAISCLAFNRPSEEFNAAPFNSLAFHQRRDSAPTLQVFAWPDALKPGQPVELYVAVNNRSGTDISGTAASSYHAEAPIPSDLRRDFSGARMLEVEIKGVSTKLFFEIAQVEAVLGTLNACTQALPRR